MLPPVLCSINSESASVRSMLEAESLECQIQNLRWTRDLLLPRLLSGRVDLKSYPVSES